MICRPFHDYTVRLVAVQGKLTAVSGLVLPGSVRRLQRLRTQSKAKLSRSGFRREHTGTRAFVQNDPFSSLRIAIGTPWRCVADARWRVINPVTRCYNAISNLRSAGRLFHFRCHSRRSKREARRRSGEILPPVAPACWRRLSRRKGADSPFSTLETSQAPASLESR